jgi:hypothetical protein
VRGETRRDGRSQLGGDVIWPLKVAKAKFGEGALDSDTSHNESGPENEGSLDRIRRLLAIISTEASAAEAAKAQSS